MQYTSLVNVLAELPNERPKDPYTQSTYTANNWNIKLQALIEENSQLIDDSVGGNYSFAYNSGTQKFPDIDADPATPGTIEKICRYLTVADALAYFSGIYTEDDNSPRMRRRNWADNRLKMIRSGEIEISVAGSNLKTVSVGAVYLEEDTDDLPRMNLDEMDSLL